MRAPSQAHLAKYAMMLYSPHADNGNAALTKVPHWQVPDVGDVWFINEREIEREGSPYQTIHEGPGHHTDPVLLEQARRPHPCSQQLCGYELGG